MKLLIREAIIRNTPKSLIYIEDGVPGEFSKITEEYRELEDALNQNNQKLSFIEACDLVDVTLKFQFKQFKVPTLIVMLTVYLRRAYKPFRNRLVIAVGLNKEYFNGTKESA